MERLDARLGDLDRRLARGVLEARAEAVLRQVGELGAAVGVAVGAPAVHDLVRAVRHVRPRVRPVLVDRLLEDVALELLGREARRRHVLLRDEVGHLAHLVLVVGHAVAGDGVAKHELVRLATQVRLDVLLREVLHHPHPRVLREERLRWLAGGVVKLLRVDLVEGVLVGRGRALTGVLVDDLVRLALVFQVDALLDASREEPPHRPPVLVFCRRKVGWVLKLALRLGFEVARLVAVGALPLHLLPFRRFALAAAAHPVPSRVGRRAR